MAMKASSVVADLVANTTIDTVAYQVNYGTVPAKLKNKKGFVNWHYEPREDGGMAKVPVDSEGRHINPLDSRHQADFDTVRKRAETNNLGIGFVIKPSHGLVGIDIDHCRDAEGNLSPQARSILERCNSYAEYSPSENGLHIWIEDSDIEDIKRCRNDEIGLEIYTNKRFFTVTGNHVEGTPATIKERNGTARELVESYMVKKSEKQVSPPPEPVNLLSDYIPEESSDDDVIIERIRRSRQGGLFHELFDLGRTERYGGDDSAADMALMDILPFWTRGNPEQMERIFSRSALAERNKWQDRPDYRERTVQAALASWNGSFYGDNGDSREALADELQLRRRDGKIAPCAENFETILREDKNLAGVLAFDQFAQRLVKRKRPPWRSGLGEWTDTDDAHLRSYLSRNYEGLRNPQILLDAITVVSQENAFHPVIEYLESLAWDGTPRADTVFIQALDVPDDAYARSITRFWLKAAVKRVLEPGCKFDNCLVLAGPQGTGKSTILSRLGKSWFNDSIDSINGKDAILEVHSGSWIIELGEMQAARRSDNEAIKAFISRTTDIIRLPYERRTQTLPRPCVFAGSTNDTEPLRDKTGGRRFWILKTEATSADTVERLSKMTEEYIDQVWAEVYQSYKEEKAHGTVSLLPPQEVLERARELQEQATEGSELIAQIESFLETPIPKEEIWDGFTKQQRRDFFQIGHYTDSDGERILGTRCREEVCSSEIANELFGIDNLNRDKATLREINTIMSGLSEWHRAEGSRRMGPYGIQKNIYLRGGVPG